MLFSLLHLSLCDIAQLAFLQAINPREVMQDLLAVGHDDQRLALFAAVLAQREDRRFRGFIIKIGGRFVGLS